MIDHEQGVLNGANLLHSFDRFNIPIDASATFTGPDAIANILARVTGDTPSEIDGLLRSTIPAADLFLLNPNGVMFGREAQLDIGGSLHVSTAHTLIFEDGSLLTVSDSGQSGITSAPPAAFGFLHAPAAATFTESIIDVDSGQGIQVVAGDISLDDTVLTAPSGRIDIVSLADAATVGLDPDARDFDQATAFGALSITNDIFLPEDTAKQERLTSRLGRAFVFDLDAVGDSGGAIDIQAGVIDMVSGSVVSRSTGAGMAGDINVRADAISMVGVSRFSSDSRAIGASGQVSILTGNLVMDRSQIDANTDFSSAGTVTIEADTLEMTGGAFMGAIGRNTDGQGGLVTVSGGALTMEDASTISVDASFGEAEAGSISLSFDQIHVAEDSLVRARGFAFGDSGNILIEADQLTIDSGDIVAEAIGEGAGGHIEVRAGEIMVTGFGSFDVSSYTALSDSPGGTITISADSLETNNGYLTAGGFNLAPAGRVEVDVGQLTIRSHGGIDADANFHGGGGEVDIRADNVDVVADFGGISADARGEGTGGRIDINAGRVYLEDSISADNVFTGDAGVVNVIADEVILADRFTAISANSRRGNAGTVSIDANTIVAGLFTDIAASSDGGSGGLVDITIGDEMRIEGGSISVRGGFGDVGSGGTVTIDGGSLVVTERGDIGADSADFGIAGSIFIDVESLEVSDFSSINAYGGEVAGAVGGSIEIDAERVLLNRGDIIVLANAGTVGDVRVTADEIILTNFSHINATTEDGEGGEILIQAGQLLVEDLSGIEASTFGEGTAGSITIEAGEFDLLDQSSVVSAAVFSGDGGSIAITADSIAVDKSFIDTGNSGPGRGGSIDIVAGEMSVANLSIVEAQTSAVGDGGDIRLAVDDLLVADSEIKTNTLRTGDAGNLTIEAGNITVQGTSLISSASFWFQFLVEIDGVVYDQLFDPEVGDIVLVPIDDDGLGNAGNLSIVADSISLLGGAVTTESQGPGVAGNLTISAETVRLDNGAELSAATFERGDAGRLAVTADRLALEGGSAVLALTTDAGSGGEIAIVADTVELSGESLIRADTFGSGDAGRLMIDAESLTLDDSAIISVSFEDATGNGGAIDIQADRTRLLNGSVAGTSTFSTGEGGEFRLTGTTLELRDESIIESLATASGDAGSIEIDLTDALSLFAESRILTNAEQSGGGNMFINATNLIRLESSAFRSSTQGEDVINAGGDIVIDPTFVVLRDSEIVARAVAGDGGAIFIDADNLIVDLASVIDASSERGNDGTIEITSPDSSVSGAIGVLSVDIGATEAILSEPCSARVLQNRSSLVYDPLPDTPHLPHRFRSAVPSAAKPDC